MKDWFGKAYDYIVQTLGNLIIKQKWTDYKKWTDFTEGRWITPEILKEAIQYSNPPYKFFVWWLRYAVFIMGKIIINIKIAGTIGIRAVYKLNVPGTVKIIGLCNLIVKILISAFGNVKIQGNACISQYVPWYRFSTWQEFANATNNKWYFKC
jgi:hypothetical protein